MQNRTHPTRQDAYTVITDRILAALEAGTVPWRKPWNSAAHGALRNAVTHHAYRGVNVPMLALTATTAGYTDPRWLTFRQAKQAGGSVRKGEKGTPVVFWQWIAKEDDDGEPVRFPILRLYTVFNVAQCDGLKVEPLATVERTEPERIDAAERIVEGFHGRPEIRHGGGHACYRPAMDTVQMPFTYDFENAEGYYLTLFHELTHATGHTSRLDRFAPDSAHAFGSADYSKEELIAEMGAAFLAGEAGIVDATVGHSASYIASWLRALKNDKRMVVTAAAQAQKAADHILGRDERTTEPAAA